MNFHGIYNYPLHGLCIMCWVSCLVHVVVVSNMYLLEWLSCVYSHCFFASYAYYTCHNPENFCILCCATQFIHNIIIGTSLISQL